MPGRPSHLAGGPRSRRTRTPVAACQAPLQPNAVGRSPDGADRERGDPVSEREGVRAGMEHGSGDEAISEFVAQPGQVPRVACGYRRARFDPKAEDALSAQFGDDVDLAPAVLVAKMVEA